MLDNENEEDAPYRSMDAMHALFAGFRLAPSGLVTLHLDRANLKNSQRDLAPALKLGALKELKIVQCKHADIFLTALSETTSFEESPMQLERLIIYHAQSQDVNMDPATTGDPDPIIKAEKGVQAITYPLAEWTVLCRSLMVLQQLDSAFPSVVADGDIYKHWDFLDYVQETTSIRGLQVLGINDYPLQLGTDPQHHNANRSRWRDPVYRPMMSELASMILWIQPGYWRVSIRESLKIITFGVTEQIKRGDSNSRLDSMLFAKSHVKVLDGEQEVRMEQVDPSSLNYHTIQRARREYDIDALARDGP
ncbi:MAG: hypothetical protein L6R38_006569 [Xanthoria sp. 2 TBL-2021]|nr:MAG: hypothetical protein L6R38_006569 [Xanthoria sp. 2 TBL-2021]